MKKTFFNFKKYFFSAAILPPIFAHSALALDDAHAMHGMDHAQHHHAHADHADTEMNHMQAMGDMGTDPWLTYAKLDQFEWQDADEASVMAWKLSAWSGKSIDKLWFNAEGERVRGHTEHAETQLLYSHAISTFWDVQAGVRSDIDPQPDLHWATVGVRGVAPYWFDVDAQFFVAEHGRTAARIALEYELLLTQKLALVPEIEANAYGKDDEMRGIGSGLSDIETGLRLRYEIVREIAPYIGIVHHRKLGTTANLAREHDEDVKETLFVAGVSLWF